MTAPILEEVQTKLDGLAKDHFTESDYELFCALVHQLEKYRKIADDQREALYNQDKEFGVHMEIQQAEINSLTETVAYWQREATLLYVENRNLKEQTGEGAKHGGGDDPNGIDTKCG